MKKVRFDRTARSERYFTATLLAHILMDNNFEGLKKLFKKYNVKPCVSGDIEVISELDPLRDPSVYNADIKKIFRCEKRLAVPDLFLRWGKSILIVEAKFFTDPADDKLEDQVNLQKKAIELVRKHTIYDETFTITYALLTIEKHTISGSNIKCIQWEKLIKLLEKTSMSKDMKYAISKLKAAIKRAGRKTWRGKYKKMHNIKDLLDKIPALLNDGYFYVGFSGGTGALENATLGELKQRDHYKVSKTRISDNWIQLGTFLEYYINKL